MQGCFADLYQSNVAIFSQTGCESVVPVETSLRSICSAMVPFGVSWHSAHMHKQAQDRFMPPKAKQDGLVKTQTHIRADGRLRSS